MNKINSTLGFRLLQCNYHHHHQNRQVIQTIQWKQWKFKVDCAHQHPKKQQATQKQQHINIKSRCFAFKETSSKKTHDDYDSSPIIQTIKQSKESQEGNAAIQLKSKSKLSSSNVHLYYKRATERKLKYK